MVLLLVASPLRRRAWVGVLELLVRIVYVVPFVILGLLVLFSHVRSVNLSFYDDTVDLSSASVASRLGSLLRVLTRAAVDAAH